MDITQLLVEVVAGAAGGNIAANIFKQYSLGTAGNTIAGILGGAVGGQILSIILSLTAQGGMDIGTVIENLVGGGLGGAVLLIVAGAIKTAMNKPQ